jgi:hypothetical protein
MNIKHEFTIHTDEFGQINLLFVFLPFRLIKGDIVSVDIFEDEFNKIPDNQLEYLLDKEFFKVDEVVIEQINSVYCSIIPETDNYKKGKVLTE